MTGKKNDMISKQLPRQLASASHPLPPVPEKTTTLGGDLGYTKTTFVIKESELQNEGKTLRFFLSFNCYEKLSTY